MGLLGLLHTYMGWRALPDLENTARSLGAVLLFASYASYSWRPAQEDLLDHYCNDDACQPPPNA